MNVTEWYISPSISHLNLNDKEFNIHRSICTTYKIDSYHYVVDNLVGHLIIFECYFVGIMTEITNMKIIFVISKHFQTLHVNHSYLIPHFPEYVESPNVVNIRYFQRALKVSPSSKVCTTLVWFWKKKTAYIITEWT